MKKRESVSVQPDLGNLQDFRRWQDRNPGFTLTDYAGIHLTPDLAVAVTKLFWPDLLVHQGGVFFADHFDPPVFSLWMEKLNGNLQQVEKAINHRHVRDLLNCSDKLNHANIVYLGTSLRESWETCLHARFPGHPFVVEGEPDQEADDYEITFYQRCT